MQGVAFDNHNTVGFFPCIAFFPSIAGPRSPVIASADLAGDVTRAAPLVITDDSLVGRPALLRRVAVSDGEIVLFGMAPSPVCPIGQGFRRGGEEVVYTNAQGGRLTDPAPIVIASPPRG